MHCSPSPARTIVMDENNDTKSLLAISAASNTFGLKLLKKIVDEEPGKNIFISPMSISMALAMTLNGAEGETKKAMLKTLEFSEIDLAGMNRQFKERIRMLKNLDPAVKLQIANSIWYRSDFQIEKQFIKVNQDNFDARISGVDFRDAGTVNLINSWVADHTNQKITKIVKRIDPLDFMYLINAVYFKGNWTHSFNPESTKEDFFNLPDGTKKPCKMMSKKEKFKYFEDDRIQAIELPYGKELFSMVVILPRENVGLDSLITNLNLNLWDTWNKQLSKNEVLLRIPKFKLEFDKSLKKTLASLGMGVAFSGDANFKKMTRQHKLLISEVKHKTFIDVNEEGTEAAAVTSVRMMLASVRTNFIMFVNRPFLFAIKENRTGQILFLGKIVDPANNN